MNFVKRAAFSLVARTGKTALLLGIFLVICTLLLGGFLLQGATARQEAQAQRRIGVDVTIRGDGLTMDADRKVVLLERRLERMARREQQCVSRLREPAYKFLSTAPRLMT
ncbi:hypothetical protein QZH56_01500 [Streptomyces olivoreticuli]|uniref:hypothetical protein n=1 Tax=Streptomyces olivoreticuli TaxID=68246 RepID=UPI002657CC8D|nr:hypothetical protein [Streptomyces olivoreticuli]WKK24370.1 hypothetical protein QZH56_01500 [Streptomyces olivoreticuli]